MRPVALEAGPVARGAAVGVVVGGAVAVVANLVDAVSDGDPAAALPLLLATLAGLGGGGWVAARASRRSPLVHAAAAALAAVTVLLFVNLVRRLATGDDLDAAYLVVWWLLALACGLGGGLAALRGPGPAGRAGRADSRP